MKLYSFGKDARSKILDGIRLMYNSVTPTMGPNGQNVLIEISGRVVELTKDGVTVAEYIQSSDPTEEEGCQIVREASQRVNDEAGDGTTTVVVLAKEMCEQSMDLPKDVSVISVKRGMKKAVDLCVQTIQNISQKISSRDEFLNVAKTSCQDEKVAELVTDAFVNAGENGSVEIEGTDDMGIEVEKTDGISFNRGWKIPHCVNDTKKLRSVAENIPVLVTDREIKDQTQLIPIMEAVASEMKTNKLFIIADEFSGDGLGMIAANHKQKSFFVIPVKAPSFGVHKIGILKDIAAATGATFISEEEGLRLEQATIEDLGKAKKVIADEKRTIIIAEDTDETKERIQERIQLLKTAIEEEKDDIHVKYMKQRLATLTDGITVIRVGGATNQERHELKYRVEDAVRALQSAKEEGIVAGCGSALLQCRKPVFDLIASLPKEEALGAEIVYKSLRSPALRILEVAGIQDREFLVSSMVGNQGYDFKNLCIGDMIEAGVWDAAKSVRCEIEYSSSCASSFLTTGVTIANEDDAASILKKFAGLLK